MELGSWNFVSQNCKNVLVKNVLLEFQIEIQIKICCPWWNSDVGDNEISSPKFILYPRKWIDKRVENSDSNVLICYTNLYFLNFKMYKTRHLFRQKSNGSLEILFSATIIENFLPTIWKFLCAAENSKWVRHCGWIILSFTNPNGALVSRENTPTKQCISKQKI